MRSPRAVVLACALVAVLLMTLGCTQREGGSNDVVLPTSTSTSQTTVPFDSATTTTVAGRSPEEIRQSLNAAVSARNFCDLTAALDDAVPDVTDGQAVIATYEAISSAVIAAQAFRPAVLADPWAEVTDGVKEGVTAAKQVAGNLDAPSLRAPFTAAQFEAAMNLVESWSDTNCPAG